MGSFDFDADSRRELFQVLLNLPEVMFEQLLFSVRPPPGIVPPLQASQGSRVSALLNWGDSVEGGLQFIHNEIENLQRKGDQSRNATICLEVQLFNHDNLIENRREEYLIEYPSQDSKILFEGVFISTDMISTSGANYKVEISNSGQPPFFIREGSNIPITGKRGKDWLIKNFRVFTFRCDVWCRIYINASKVLSYDFHIGPPGSNASKERFGSQYQLK